MSLSYDNLTTVLNMARGRLNDELTTLQPVSGKVLKNTQSFTQQTVNSAWRRFQDVLAERGYARLINEVIIPNFPICTSTDPASQMWIDATGTFNGTVKLATPTLPADLAHPLKIWERWSNQNAPFCDPPMEKMLDGIPSNLKTTALRFWEWREDAVYVPGSQMLEDLRIRYVTYLPDFNDVAPNPLGLPPNQVAGAWFVQPVPIMRSADSFSWYICGEFAAARGEDPARFFKNGDDAINRVFNLDVQADQRVNIRRQPRSGRGRGYGRSSYYC